MPSGIAALSCYSSLYDIFLFYSLFISIFLPLHTHLPLPTALSRPESGLTLPRLSSQIFEYWGPSKRLLGDMSFLQQLKDYDKDNIPEAVMDKINKEYVRLPEFDPVSVAKASSAAEGLCKWVRAMASYNAIAKVCKGRPITSFSFFPLSLAIFSSFSPFFFVYTLYPSLNSS